MECQHPISNSSGVDNNRIFIIIDQMKVSVIVPVFNEIHNIESILRAVAEVNIDSEIIVVDDYSTDGTRDYLRTKKGIKTVFHDKNVGKGAAIRSGLSIAQGRVVIIQDADLEYSPGQYPKLLSPIQEARTRVVYGSRVMGKGEFLALSYIANRFLTLLTNLLYKSHLTDMETCYKVIETDLLRRLHLISSRFEIEPEITCKILKKHEKIIELPITYRGRRTGKKIGPKDGIQAVWNIVKWKFKK
jgi:glycosyltransferase involved in cell wall biosynthesis